MNAEDIELISHIGLKKGVKPAEGQLLYQLGVKAVGNIVEIGSYLGRSTSFIGLGTKAGNQCPIFCIDPWRAPPETHLYETYWANIQYVGLSQLVTPLRMRSEDAFHQKCPGKAWAEGIDLLFIDGDHLADGVRKDLLWVGLVNVGGMVVFHDYDNPDWPDVKAVVDQYRETTGWLVEVDRVGHLAVYVKYLSTPR